MRKSIFGTTVKYGSKASMVLIRRVGWPRVIWGIAISKKNKLIDINKIKDQNFSWRYVEDITYSHKKMVNVE